MHELKREEETQESEKGLWEVRIEGDWEVIPVKLDTGACDWVFTPEVAKAFPLMETPSSRNGRHFQGANDSLIENFGERRVKGFTGDEVAMCVGAQIADVSRNLASGFKIMAAGNKIVLDDAGSYIQNKSSGHKINIVNQNGEFKFEIWVPKAKSDSQVKPEPRPRKVAQPRRSTQTKIQSGSQNEESDEHESGFGKRRRVDDLDEDDSDDLDLLFVGQV